MAGGEERRGFDQRVMAVVAQIPPGQLATYGQIAELIGAWGAAQPTCPRRSPGTGW